MAGYTLPLPLQQHTIDLYLKQDESTLYPHTSFQYYPPTSK